MAITLADAQKNCQSDIDFAAIDQYRRSSWFLDQLLFDDCVNPAGGGATLTYGYTRLVNARLGAFRAINSEYTAGKATRTQATVDLKPVGDSFEVDRVLSNLGPAATNEVAFQMTEAIKGATTAFINEVVNGDLAVNANGFDGLDKILTGSTTEDFGGKDPSSNEYIDWTAATVNSEALAHTAIDILDEFLGLVVGGANAIVGNRKSIARVRSLARRAGYYSRDEDAFGNVVERFGPAVLVDAGTKVADESTTETDIVAIESRDVDADEGASTAAVTGLTDLYAVNFGLDSFHGVATVGQLVKTWLPDFTSAGAVKKGEVEMGPVAVALKRTTGAAVLRNIKVQ